MLYLVATPIGHLGDFSHRAVQCLKTCQGIACEDTRVSAKLLKHYGISKPMLSYRDANEERKAQELVERLQAGETWALVSDAGTPLINDPGFRLVRACREQGIPVVPIPGPCALITALSASGLPVHRFLFEGFLPPKRHGRCVFFQKQAQADYTVIAYESCHRIQSALRDLIETLGPERVICVARELTKLHETFLTGPAGLIAPQVPAKGECVLLIAPEGFAWNPAS